MPASALQTPIDTNIDSAAILRALGLTAFHWQRSTDALVWSSTAAQVLRLSSPPATGEGFEQILGVRAAVDRWAMLLAEKDMSSKVGAGYRTAYPAPLGTHAGPVYITETGCGFWRADLWPDDLSAIMQVRPVPDADLSGVACAPRLDADVPTAGETIAKMTQADHRRRERLEERILAALGQRRERLFLHPIMNTRQAGWRVAAVSLEIPSLSLPGCVSAYLSGPARRTGFHRLATLTIQALRQNPTLRLLMRLPARLLLEADLADAVMANLTGDVEGRLILELDGTALIGRHDLSHLVHRLKHRGIKLAVAGLAPGEIGIAGIASLQVDSLRVWAPMVRRAFVSSDMRFALRMMILEARRSGLQIMANGVEERGLAAMLNGMGCFNQQGGLYPAVPLAVGEGQIRGRARG